MYLNYYQLNVKPFQITSDPKFLWQGEKHKEALATLRYGILDNRGFLLLTGEVGTGKTILINRLVSMLDVDTVVVALGTTPNPLIPSTTEGLDTTKKGTVVADQETGKTVKDKVWAGGDLVTGAATVISAMGAGKRAAAAIDAYLKG